MYLLIKILQFFFFQSFPDVRVCLTEMGSYYTYLFVVVFHFFLGQMHPV